MKVTDEMVEAAVDATAFLDWRGDPASILRPALEAAFAAISQSPEVAQAVESFSTMSRRIAREEIHRAFEHLEQQVSNRGGDSVRQSDLYWAADYMKPPA